MLLDVPAVVRGPRAPARAERRPSGSGIRSGGLHRAGGGDAPTQAQLQGLVTLGSPVYLSLDTRTRVALRLGLFFGFPRRIHLGALARLGVPLAGLAPPSLMAGMISAANVDPAMSEARARPHGRADLARGADPVLRLG